MTNQELDDLIDDTMPDNSDELITPAIVRTILHGLVARIGNQLLSGHYAGAAPPDPPPDPTLYARAYDLDDPHDDWHWNPDTSAWQ